MVLYKELIDSPSDLSASRFRDAARFAVSHRLPLAVDWRRPSSSAVPVGLLKEFGDAVAELCDIDVHSADKFAWYFRRMPGGGRIVRRATERGRSRRDFGSPEAAKAAATEAIRCIGWMRWIASRDCAARRLFRAGEPSNTGLTYFVVEPRMLFESCPSPQRFNRWVRDVMSRSQKILAGWGLHSSYRLFSRLLLWTDARVEPVGKAARRLAAVVLQQRFGPAEARWAEDVVRIPRPQDLAAYAYYGGRRSPDEATVERAVSSMGPLQDGEMEIPEHTIVCSSRSGLIIRDGGSDLPHSRTWAQVVVRCPTTGRRHAITVPPWFALPLRPGESPEGRVKAAVAWTFRMSRLEYRPGVEA